VTVLTVLMVVSRQNHQSSNVNQNASLTVQRQIEEIEEYI